MFEESVAFDALLTRVQCCTAAHARCGFGFGFGFGFDLIGGFVVVGCFQGLALGLAAPTELQQAHLT